MHVLPSVALPVRRYLGLGLCVLAVGLASCAMAIWANRMATPVIASSDSEQRAWVLLERSLRADAELPLSARVQTVVFAGNRQIQSEAQLLRAPGHLAVSYLSGPMRGQESGYSQRWFWRQDRDGELAPYAEVARTPSEMARARFELMRKNYSARLQSPQELNGRTVEVVELRPRKPVPGASGPARRLFIDAQTGLTLRTEAFNYRLQPISHSTFSQLKLQPAVEVRNFESPSAIAAAAKASFWQGEELGQNKRAVEQKVGLVPPQSDLVPRGFIVDSVGVHRCAHSVPGVQVAAFTRYSDGLNELTLFSVKTLPLNGASKAELRDSQTKMALQTPLNTGDVANISCNFGPGTVMSRADGQGILLAMGDLPSDVLQRVLDDAKFQAVAHPATAGALIRREHQSKVILK